MQRLRTPRLHLQKVPFWLKRRVREWMHVEHQGTLEGFFFSPCDFQRLKCIVNSANVKHHRYKESTEVFAKASEHFEFIVYGLFFVLFRFVGLCESRSTKCTSTIRICSRFRAPVLFQLKNELYALHNKVCMFVLCWTIWSRLRSQSCISH